MSFLTRLQKQYLQVAQYIPNLVAIGFLFIFGIFFSLIAVHRFWQYEAWYYDFGIFARAIYAVSQFQIPIIDHFVVTDKIIFADHFHPFIFLLSPLFWFTNKPEVLLIAQTVMVSVSGWFVYLTAKAVTKKSFLALCLLTIYLSFTGLHFALISEFHEITLLPLPLSIFFYALVKKKTWLYILSTILVLSVKESAFIIPAFFCLLEIVTSNKKWRMVNVGLLLFSILYGVAAIKFIIPYFSGGSYSYLNENSFSLSNLQKLFDTPLKIQTIWKSLLSFGFLPLLSPHTLLPVVVNWYTRFSSLATTRHDLGMHYNAEIAPTFILATIYGVRRLQNLIKRDSIVHIAVAIITVWTVFFSFFVLNSPIRLALIPDFYRHSREFEFLNTLVATVPEGGIVMAQANLTPRFIDRKVYMLRFDYEEYSPKWIVVDTRAGQNPNNFYGVGEPNKVFEKLAKDPHYRLYYQQGEQYIYQKVE